MSAQCTRIGRLAPGATVENAVAELSTIARNEELKNGMANTSMAVVATPLMTHLLGPARPALLAIAGASGALLLIACANAAALLLVHGAGRRREVAVRFALGARRLQIVRQLFCESIVLSLIAGVLGVGLAYVSFGAIVSLAPIEVPRLDEAAIDVRALLFALVLCLGTAVMVGLLPAWRHSGAAPLAGLHERSRSATAASSSARARKLLVAAQLAAVVVLLTAAGLFIRSFTALLRLDLGFDPRGVLTFNLGFSEEKHDTKEKQWALVDAVLDSARRLPGADCRRRRVSAALRAWRHRHGHQRHHRGAAARRREREPQPDTQLGSCHAGLFPRHGHSTAAGQALRRARHGKVAAGGHHRAVAGRAAVAGTGSDRQAHAGIRRTEEGEEATHGRRSSAWSKTPGIVKSKRRGSTCICRTARRRIRSSTSWCACRAIRLRRSRR